MVSGGKSDMEMSTTGFPSSGLEEKNELKAYAIVGRRASVFAGSLFDYGKASPLGKNG